MTSVKFNIKESSYLAYLAARRLRVSSVAITIGRTIHLHKAGRRDLLSNRSWLRHELKHVEQYNTYGLIPFLWLYLVEWLRHGYWNNRFEIEARSAESDEAYDPVNLCAQHSSGTFIMRA